MRLAIVLLAVLLARPALAQKAADHVALGDSARLALKPREALEHYQAVLATDSLHYVANTRAALAAAGVAQQKGDYADRRDVDSLYKLANDYARRAVRIDSTKAEGHFLIALTLGYMSQGKSPAVRLSTAGEVFREATKAVALDLKHDGAHHVLGRWHREVSQGRAMAQGMVDGALGDIATKASPQASVEHLEKAVQLAPTYIYHRLDLAETYMALKRNAEAQAHLAKIDSLPATDVKDPTYKGEAKALLGLLQATSGQPQS